MTVNENICPVCAKRKKKRGEAEYAALMNRLKRIEGQVRGVEKMLENEAWCPDIMVQIAAINAALHGFNKQLLAEHIRSCVLEDIKAGHDEAVDQLVETLRRVMK